MRVAPIMAFVSIIAVALASAQAFADGWSRTKDIADDVIHAGRTATFYCGCEYKSHGDSNGSGDITSTSACGFDGPSTHAHRAGRVEWEHVVPASLMPARQFSCWTREDGGRDVCERSDPRAQAMIFDLHNLVPSIGQVNALRSNDRYADLPADTSDFAGCAIEDSSGFFEPPDCKKGDVARIWLYMNVMYGVAISSEELTMFNLWAFLDPVSPWESEREERIADYTRVNNPFVHDVAPDQAGACPWE